MDSLSSQPLSLESRPKGETVTATKNSSAISNPGTASDKAESQASLDAFEQSRIAFFSK